MKLTTGLISLFLKSNCPLCDRPTAEVFCQYCDNQLKRCQLSNPSQFWQGELPLFVWGNYGGVLKRTLATLKYNNQPQLARPLGYWLGQAWRQSPAALATNKLIVIPIPLHSTKLQQRGYNQAERLAESFCQVTGYKQYPQGLERLRATEAQFNLTAQARSQNLTDAFVVSQRLSQRPPTSPVLLLDDIYTTGATVSSAAQTLRRQGIQVYGVVAIATSKKLLTLTE
ncbi:MAG: ComF family protein [Kastovskya adunca ATA6-11-RM4]|nr:ComF family protein [Kastovskya adunca ATA6-11-RM4]